MERDSATNSVGPQNEKPSQWKGLSRVLRFLFSGLLLAFLAATELCELHGIHARWVLSVCLIFSVVELFSLQQKKSASAYRQLLILLILPFLALAFCFCHHVWAPALLALAFLGMFSVRYKSTRRIYSLLLAGSLIAGVYPYWFSWPNDQRCLLVVVGVGVSIAMQSVWLIVRCLLTGEPVLPPEALDPAQELRALLRAIHWMIGSIEHTQIFSSDLIQRIQKRYNNEINCLHNLGFSDGFYDAEMTPAVRFLNPLLALALAAMYSKKEVMTLEPGLKISNCHPVLLAPGRETFAFGYMEGLGVAFYTAFADGTLLVTKNHGENRPSASEEVIVKRYKGASIGSAWENHQSSIRELCERGKTVIRDASHRAYVEVDYRETHPRDPSAAKISLQMQQGDIR
jgi:hypothetical protein